MSWMVAKGEGKHFGLICNRPQTWREAVFPFLAEGLAAGEKCVYLTALHTPKMIASLLAQEVGADIDTAQEQERFSVADASQNYMPQGWFDPDGAIRRYSQAAKKALDQGYSGLRVVGDMAWACYEPSCWGRLMEYEQRVNAELFDLFPIKAICFYDGALFAKDFLATMERIHHRNLGEGPVSAGREMLAVGRMGMLAGPAMA